MRSCSFLAFAAAICLLTSSCKPALQPEIPAVHQEEPENKGDDTDNDNTSQEQSMTINITIGGLKAALGSGSVRVTFSK